MQHLIYTHHYRHSTLWGLAAVQGLAMAFFIGYWMYVEPYVGTGDPKFVMPDENYDPGMGALLWLFFFPIFGPVVMLYLDLFVFKEIHHRSMTVTLGLGLLGWWLVYYYGTEVVWLLD